MTLSLASLTKSSAFLAISAAGLALASVAQTAEISANIQQYPLESHPSQGDVKTINGSTATLVRTSKGIFANVDTAELTSGNAYTLWLVVVNEPGACESSPCKPPDILQNTAETKADIGYAAGIVATDNGGVRFTSFQPVGDLRGAWFGNGLHNPAGAEIHLVINDHGPLLPEFAQTMLTSYRGGCTDESLPAAFPATAKNDGKPGPNDCRLVQAVIFVSGK